MADSLDDLAARAAAQLTAHRPPKASVSKGAAPLRPEPGMVCTKTVIRDKNNRIEKVIEVWSRVGDPPPEILSTAAKSFLRPLKPVDVAPPDERVPLTAEEIDAIKRETS